MATVDSGERINRLINEEKWEEARRLILKALESEPDSHWLLTQLGETYYEQRQYKKALQYLLQSREIVPDCPLTLWHLAGALDALGYYGGAVRILTWLLESKKTAEDDPCWESASWTDALKTDCVFQLGVSFRHMNKKEKAAHCYRQYISLLLAGAPGSYPIQEASEQLMLLHPVKPAAFQVELRNVAKEIRNGIGKSTRLPTLDAKKLQQLQV